MKIISKIFVLIIILQCSTALLFAQNDKKPPLTRVLFIMDASTSMEEYWQGSIKFSTARRILSELLDSLSQTDNYEYMEFALRAFGHQSQAPPEDCKDTRLEVPFAKDNIQDIEDCLNNMVPKGTTPIAYSLEQCADDFPDCDQCRNIIILITDGLERCGGDPCAISMALMKKGIVLKPYVLGIALDVDAGDILDCVGNYYDLKKPEEFKTSLNDVINQITHMTSVQVNLLDSNGKPTETDAVMSFHDNLSGSIRYNYIHTINKLGNPDTVYLDVLSTYNLKVHTIPPVYLDTIVLDPDTHNIIELDAPQGLLKVDIKGEDERNSNIKCIVRQTGFLETLYVLDADKSQKFITGLYDIEILTIPRIYKYAVKVAQSEETVIDVPQPGEVIINFSNPIYGSLMSENGDILTNLYDFKPGKMHYKFRLQPGYYNITYRESQHFKTGNSSEAGFRVRSGKTEILNL
jgi:Ca-activated chloride channel family protein